MGADEAKLKYTVKEAYEGHAIDEVVELTEKEAEALGAKVEKAA